MRRLVAAALLLAALAVPSVPSALAADRVTLPGTLTLSGSSTGGVQVRIPRATSIDIGNKDQRNGKGVTINGRGRFVGIVIKQHANKDKSFDVRDRTVYALRYSLCGTPTCDAPAYYASMAYDPKTKVFTDTPSLPVGDYDIFLVADGQPTTVTLRFKGLTGARALSPVKAQRAVQWTPNVVVEQIAGGHGTRSRSGERGLVMTAPSAVVMASWRQSTAMQWRMTTCLQMDSAESAAVTPAADCAAGLSDGRTVVAVNEEGEMACIGLCTLGLEEAPFAFGFLFFAEVPALPGARLLSESQATGQFGYETVNTLVLPW